MLQLAGEGVTRGTTRQIHALSSQADLATVQVCWRMTSRWDGNVNCQSAFTAKIQDGQQAATGNGEDCAIPEKWHM